MLDVYKKGLGKTDGTVEIHDDNTQAPENIPVTNNIDNENQMFHDWDQDGACQHCTVEDNNVKAEVFNLVNMLVFLQFYTRDHLFW